MNSLNACRTENKRFMQQNFKISELRRIESALIARSEVLKHLASGAPGLHSLIALAVLPDVLPRHQSEYIRAEIAETQILIDKVQQIINFY